MNHEKFFICVSAITTASFFSSIAGIGYRSVKVLLHFSDYYGPAIESEYKSPFYKLWQHVIKDKSFTHNNSIVHFDYKQHFHRQQILTSYQYSPKRLRPSNYTKQSASLLFKKWLLLENSLSSHKHRKHNIGWHHMLCFFSYAHAIDRISLYAKNILEKCQTYSHKMCSKLNNFVSRSYRKTMFKRFKESHIDINKHFLHKVYGL